VLLNPSFCSPLLKLLSTFTFPSIVIATYGIKTYFRASLIFVSIFSKTNPAHRDFAVNYLLSPNSHAKKQHWGQWRLHPPHFFQNTRVCTQGTAVIVSISFLADTFNAETSVPSKLLLVNTTKLYKPFQLRTLKYLSSWSYSATRSSINPRLNSFLGVGFLDSQLYRLKHLLDTWS